MDSEDGRSASLRTYSTGRSAPFRIRLLPPAGP